MTPETIKAVNHIVKLYTEEYLDTHTLDDFQVYELLELYKLGLYEEATNNLTRTLKNNS